MRLPVLESSESLAPAPVRTPARYLRFVLLAATCAASILIHGYHPYVVDASIYVTGIKERLHPSLYSQDNAFVAEHAKFSAFSVVIAKLQTGTGSPLDWVLFLTYIALVYCFLSLSYLLAKRIFMSEVAGWGAALLVGACLPIPIAATSLLLIDPYLTARSFSAPLALLALLACVEERRLLALGSCVATSVFHPLMSIYLTAFVLVYFLIVHRAARWITALCFMAFTASGLLYRATTSTPVSASYREAVLSRDYYFPTVWHWYEIVGLLAPLVLMCTAAKLAGQQSKAGRLALASAILGVTSCACCFCFVHPNGPYLLARLQLLRSFHTIYALGIVLLGGAIAKAASSQWRVISLAAVAMLAVGMFLMQRHIFHNVQDVEWPGARTENGWEQGFSWIRENTPQDAVFAMDARLLDVDDEAMPGFRAIAERSILTDVKDEGLASLFPPLAPIWAANRDKQRLLDSHTDSQRLSQLKGTGVSWILLSRQAPTELQCPYRNATLKVCRLTQQSD